jgi:predicted anti-sigma-YlaC factor YlaD
MDAIREHLCEPHLIAAYIDGELELPEQVLFEEHVENCTECRNELRLHQQFSCALESVLANEVEVVIPPEFSKVVAARAVSDMGGVRSSLEKKRAIIFCLALAIAGFALIGATTREMTLGLARRLFGMIFGLIDLIGHALYDFVVSVGVISRVVSRKFFVETGNGLTVLVLLALAAFLLSRLIANYHRTSTTD